MPRMTRNMFCAIAACALSAPAFAVFTGIDLREDKGQIPPVELAQIDPLGLGVRVINLYATFDGPGDWTEERPRSPNALLQVNADKTQEGPWVIDKATGRNANAGFYQDPFGSFFAPPEALIPIFPTVEWDTFVGLGRKATPSGEIDHTTPFFLDGADTLFLDQDGDGRDDGLRNSYLTGNPPAEQHVARFNAASGKYEVFFAQLTILGLDEGARLGQLRSPINGEGVYEWESDIFAGSFTLATQVPEGGALFYQFDFVRIPAPGGSCIVLPIAIAFSRRSHRCRA